MTVRVEHLSHRYRAVDALHDISVQGESGRVTAIAGPNAAGKSTLIRCIIGVLRPAAGRVFVNDEAVAALSAAQMARRAVYVPQRSSVAAAFTVREVVEIGRYAMGRDAARVEEALAKLELADLADRPYPALSVGQQQRVTLARALAQMSEGGLIVLDEPTAAMDLRHAQRCMRLLRDLAAGGATVLAAMHDLSMASHWADDAWLLHEGRLAGAGPVEEVLSPERLEPVFGVRFDRLTDSAGRARLLASAPRR